MEIEEMQKRLAAWFGEIEGSLTAFSGGVDSTLVLYLARKFLGKDKAIACISDSPSLKRSDLEEAKQFCLDHDITLEVIHTQEIDDVAYASNPTNRCYACKSHLYQDLTILLRNYPNYVVLNGTNSDDLGDYRPGLKAADQHQVKSPLSELGINKESVRKLAKHFGLSNWDKPASPCLSSRIPYGKPVTRQKLNQIELAETIVQRYGFRKSRVRHFDEEARIEVPVSDLPKLETHLSKIREAFRELGFKQTTVDAEGLVSGKLNRAITPK